MPKIGLSCACGKLQGRLDVPSPRAGNHITCHCADCRAAAIHLGQPDPGDGVALWQTTVDHLTITQGAEHLALMQLSGKGLYRWYASCCGVPLFNSPRPPRTAFVGIMANRLSNTTALGPLIGRVHVPGENGKSGHEGAPRIMWRILSKMLAANLTGRWRKTPLFNDDGTTVTAPMILTKEERKAATPS
ncbi:DUF6151 family protein [Alisedimentitalea sp. MJ-SS2]|uniref:DUF6151 family protein n=1 Tax=Aliisedimentitalea sp. MJ-SS2 TaxID=3049795 RepID=UPI002913E0DD|nr:DUF6151 family protein [Alisedimentitalea sp. MJ-SS2]MDU8926364.1 DUF6151 family protein [Alisedimentitalea sp. MJ-SS2]